MTGVPDLPDEILQPMLRILLTPDIYTWDIRSLCKFAIAFPLSQDLAFEVYKEYEQKWHQNRGHHWTWRRPRVKITEDGENIVRKWGRHLKDSGYQPTPWDVEPETTEIRRNTRKTNREHTAKSSATAKAAKTAKTSEKRVLPTRSKRKFNQVD
ncbi:hypothetical protein LTS08_006195 [Lithohypha guttulata]|nr:hypothetical protein LTS08_006195 [Lithohypha guttulata]